MSPSSREAQAEIRNATAKTETAHDAKRRIIGTNLTSDTFDASGGPCAGGLVNVRHLSGKCQKSFKFRSNLMPFYL
jgi:hypothetical protein